MSKFAAASMAFMPLTVEAQGRSVADWSVFNGDIVGPGTTFFNASRSDLQLTPYLSPRAKLFLATGQYDRMQALRMNDWATTEGAENAVVFVWKTVDEATCYAHRQAELISGFLADMIDHDHDGKTDEDYVKGLFMGLGTPKQQNIIVVGCTNPQVESMNHVANLFYNDPADQANTLKFYDAQLWNSGQEAGSAALDTAALKLANIKRHAYRAAWLAMYDMAWRHVYVELSLVNAKICLKDALGKLYLRKGSFSCYNEANPTFFKEPRQDSTAAFGWLYTVTGDTLGAGGCAMTGDATRTVTVDAGAAVANRDCVDFTASADANNQGTCWGREDEVFGDSASKRITTWNEDEEAAELVYSVFTMLREETTGFDYNTIGRANFQTATSAAAGDDKLALYQGDSAGALETALGANPGGPPALAAECQALPTFLITHSQRMGTYKDLYTATDSDAGDAVPVVFAPSQAFPTVDHQCPPADPVHVVFDPLTGQPVTCEVVTSTTPASSTTTTTNTSNSAGRALTSVGAAVLGVAALAGAALF